MALWEIDISPGENDRPFWIDLTGLPGVRCPACGTTWGVIRRLPQPLPPEISHKLKYTKGPVSPEKYRTIRDFVTQHIDLSADKALFEPNVRLGTTRVVKCHAGARCRCYVFLHSLFLPETSVQDLRPFDGNGLFLMRCSPPYEWLVEVVPIPCQRHRLFPISLCKECGRRDLKKPDKHFFNDFLIEKSTSECMISFPGIHLVTDNIKHVIESLDLPQVTIRPIPFDDIWGKMMNNLMK